MTRDFCTRCGARYDGTTPHGPGACALVGLAELKDRVAVEGRDGITHREAYALIEAVEALADLNALPTERSFARADRALAKFSLSEPK